MAKGGFSGTSEAWVDVDCNFTPQEIYDGLDDAGKVELSVLLGFPNYPNEADAIIEAAYSVAKAMDSCPREIKELFWKVHGRAMP